MRSMDEKLVADLVDLLEGAEYRLSKILSGGTPEVSVRDIALVLRDLSSIRLSLEQPTPHDKRVHGRIHEPAVVVIREPNRPDESAALHDISAGGALIEFDNPRQAGQQIEIVLPGLDKPVTAMVKAVNGGRTHVSFTAVEPDDLVQLLKYIERRFERY
jgi:hypothetical protein